MIESLKVLRRRIRSIRNTGQITRAMEMVSAAKLRRTEQAWESAKPFYTYLRRLMIHLLFKEKEHDGRTSLQHPFLESRNEGVVCLVVITSDRGLCGAFNTNVLHRAEDFIQHRLGKREVVIYCIGRRGYNYLRRHRVNIIGTVLDTAARFEPEIAEKISAELQDFYLRGEISEIHLLYSRFVSRMHQYPYVERLIPLSRALIKDEEDTREPLSPIDYIIEPDMQTLVNELLPAFLRAKISISLLEAFTSEHSARMIAMTNATRNCAELLDELTLKMNKARQSSITRELLDIVGGSEAFRKAQE
ncbi:ATP synthase F1 subunit gamma [Candidatus Sumerlaeota bacterium]|nr:ATP synthase F1 subunit gamma [Candidatus Sumerlaeota bacterium]